MFQFCGNARGENCHETGNDADDGAAANTGRTTASASCWYNGWLRILPISTIGFTALYVGSSPISTTSGK